MCILDDSFSWPMFKTLDKKVKTTLRSKNHTLQKTNCSYTGLLYELIDSFLIVAQSCY